MKFGKEFSAQMIPEWVQAYMNYNELKKILKDILIFKVSRNVSSLSGPLLHRKMSLYRTFSGLTHRCRHLSNPISPHEGNEEHVILINSNPDHFETKFLLPSEEGGEYELVFFKRLDDEFNKVNKFYKDKLEEIMAEAESLNKQMDALIAFRIKVHNPQEKFLHTGLPTYETTDQSNVNHKAEEHAETPHMESIPEAEMTQDTKQRNYCNSNSIKTTTTKDDVKLHHRIPAPSNVLDHVKFNVIVETPRSALQKILRVQDKKQLNFNEEELKMVEKRLKQAFAVFYQKLRLLKSYRSSTSDSH